MSQIVEKSRQRSVQGQHGQRIWTSCRW